MTDVVIIGGGPAGYEAALVARDQGADVVILDEAGMGGSCVLYDCVPSKTFIASTGVRTELRRAENLGFNIDNVEHLLRPSTLQQINCRVKELADAQSADIHDKLAEQGIRVLIGRGEIADKQPGLAAHEVLATVNGRTERLRADVVLIATGSSPRTLPNAQPDGERILTWRQIYDLQTPPEHLVVIGSGVTGAEFVHAYTELGVAVTAVSSRDRVLPHEDQDAARVLEEVLAHRGVTIVKNAAAESVRRTKTGVRVALADGRAVEGSHALLTVGSVPNTTGLGLEKAGIELTERGHIKVDRVSRTSALGIYAAGDCTGLLPLASVAGMQGRIAMYHALGEALSPIKLRTVTSAIFTRPEIAQVGVTQKDVDSGKVQARTVSLPLATNARAKMGAIRRGFVKLFCSSGSGRVLGGVIVAPSASELIQPIALAVRNKLTVEDVTRTFSVYPSLMGSINEAARILSSDDDE
ncbi:FAD-dependent pyridine nucleotide-disulfide oxidoreductase [Segniliparus rotundus DSM 44985]|uniref:FAD-dependent pyridine nucleotide-disulfide oxidoreductase n=1 Tax=Segniliparus rotundus (strain ATCC BAA-972 / CDC 1076 / CIP 108378 / DSM 44985 / JCM 13578) TaxID=640132 RepID=D6ZDH5_SEGRD|nr:NAD(P)H-quinone dehydrogenase [Segniliparus rotundus]ADG97239.1 FAD-dependent pyridine nucleotide-disulfide oxidoreductase [Segniliparus rotundus DSM 44985]